MNRRSVSIFGESIAWGKRGNGINAENAMATGKMRNQHRDHRGKRAGAENGAKGEGSKREERIA